MLKLCEEPTRFEIERIQKARAKLDQLCCSSQFLKFGSPLYGFGERYVQFSDKKKQIDRKTDIKSYFGEWSTETGKPLGRCIEFYKDGEIFIGYNDDGDCVTGNYITIYKSGIFKVGEIYRKDSVKWERGTQYETCGDSFDYDHQVI